MHALLALRNQHLQGRGAGSSAGRGGCMSDRRQGGSPGLSSSSREAAPAPSTAGSPHKPHPAPSPLASERSRLSREILIM